MLWNENQEKLLQDWGEQCKALSWMHYHASKKYKKSNNTLNISSIILSGIAGTGAFVNVECDSWFSFGLGILAVLASISSGANKFLNYSETYIKHKQSSNKFLGLANEIAYQLTFDRDQRIEADKFMEDCKKLYDTLISEALDVPVDIVDRFNKKFGDTELTKPQIANGVYVIDIRKNIKQINENPDVIPV